MVKINKILQLLFDKILSSKTRTKIEKANANCPMFAITLKDLLIYMAQCGMITRKIKALDRLASD